MKRRSISIIDLIKDQRVFAPHFKGDTWTNWLVFLCALFALPMTPEQLAIYQKFTGRKEPPTQPHLEAWLCIGRRGGKTFILAVIAVFLACFRDWRPYLGPGEVGLVMVVAQDRKQARQIMRYATGLIKSVPMLAALVEHQTRDTIELSCRITIEVHTASFRSTRGYTCVAALLDEIAYWPSDETSAEPDVEVVNAIRPGMATIPGAILLAASSPYARRGELYDAYRRHYGIDGDPVFCWQATTRDMNPRVPQSFIDRHIAADAARANAEYLAQFRDDISQFISREVVEACVLRGLYERPPARECIYHGFVDPSGGSNDSFTLAIGHMDNSRDVMMLDAIREVRAPFSPEQVVAEMCVLLKQYRIYRISGDRYAANWPIEQFAKHGVGYEPSTLNKSGLYIAFLPALNSGRVELLDHPRLISQLCGLERRTNRAGADQIDHAAGCHDDIVNAVAGVVALHIGTSSYSLEVLKRINSDGDEPSRTKAQTDVLARERARRLHPSMSDADYARISRVGLSFDKEGRLFVSAPTSGPDAVGAIRLDGGYKAPSCEERWALEAAQKFILAEFAKAEKNTHGTEANKDKPAANVDPFRLPRSTS